MKKTHLLFVFCVLFALPNFWPQKTSTGQVDSSKRNVILDALIVEKKLTDESKESIKNTKENALQLMQAKPKVKVVYRTKTIAKNPEQIILYVRDKDGTISEHAVRSDGGFYIIDESELAAQPDTVIIIRSDTVKEKTRWQKFFNRD